MFILLCSLLFELLRHEELLGHTDTLLFASARGVKDRSLIEVLSSLRWLLGARPGEHI